MRRPAGWSPIGLSFGAFLLSGTDPAAAGVYANIIFCDESAGTCFPRGLKTIAPDGFPYPTQPFGIVHPLGYTGAGGELRIRVCVGAGPENDRLILPTARAILTWNELLRTTGNCDGCRQWEDSQPVGEFHAESVILHELGHCAMGLGHPNLELEVPNGSGIPQSSYTAAMHSARSAISPGSDAIRGSRDDSHFAFPMKTLHGVHYFRATDNNPVIVDSTIIDTTTYLRAQGDLPGTDSWAANANESVAAALGASDTQAVMYSLQAASSRYSGLTADDVNMVELGMSGLDGLVAGGDDYTVVLELEDCGASDIMVIFGEPSSPDVLGECEGTALDFSDGSPATFDRHYSVVPFQVLPLLLRLNSDIEWDAGGPDLHIEILVIGEAPEPGNPLSYSIGAENLGSGDAAGVVITASVPDGTAFDGGASDPGWSCGAGALGVVNAATMASTCTLAVGALPSLTQAGPWAFAVIVNSPTTVADIVQTTSIADDGTNGPDEGPDDNAVITTTGVDVPCGGTQDLVLTTPDLGLLVVHEACNSITAGSDYRVASTQDVTFKARNVISFGAEFAIELGGLFKAQIDPLAGQLP